MKSMYRIFLSIACLMAYPVALWANDCSSATNISSGVTLNDNVQSASLAGAPFSGDAQCTGPGSQSDLWYSFQALSSNQFVRATPGGDLDIAIEVVDACGGSVLACENNLGAGIEETVSLSGLSVGNTYYYRVYHAAASVPTDESFTTAVAYIPAIELRDEYCGLTNYVSGDIIRSTQAGNASTVAYYQWRFEELEAPFNTYEVISPNGANPNFRLWWFDDLEYGRSYDVSVRLGYFPGPVAGTYGPSCTIEMQADVQSTQLEQQYASGFFSFCDVIGADGVAGADRYRWEFNDLSETVSVYGDDNQRLLRLSKVPDLSLGSTYIVSAFAEFNGVESPVGSLRFLNTNNFVPNTGLRDDIYTCGSTIPINFQVQAYEVCKAQSYTWRFRNTSQTQDDLFYTRVGGNRFIRLEWVTDLIVGDSYDIDVYATQGGLIGDYSTICNITIGEATGSGLWAGTGNKYTPSENHQALIAGNPDNAEMDFKLINTAGANEQIVVEMSEIAPMSTVRFELYDLNARKMGEYVQGGVSTADQITLPAQLTSGIYILRAVTTNNTVSKKVSVF